MPDVFTVFLNKDDDDDDDDLFFTLLGFLCSFYITPHYYSLSEKTKKLVAALIVTGERGAETEADSPYHIPLLMFPSKARRVRILNFDFTNLPHFLGLHFLRSQFS